MGVRVTGKEALEQCVESLEQAEEGTEYSRTSRLLLRFIRKTLSPPPFALGEQSKEALRPQDQ